MRARACWPRTPRVGHRGGPIGPSRDHPEAPSIALECPEIQKVAPAQQPKVRGAVFSPVSRRVDLGTGYREARTNDRLDWRYEPEGEVRKHVAAPSGGKGTAVSRELESRGDRAVHAAGAASPAQPARPKPHAASA